MDGGNEPDKNDEISNLLDPARCKKKIIIKKNLWTKIAKLGKPHGRKWHFTLKHIFAMNGPGCEAIHMTKIDANIDCDIFIARVDLSEFHPWCSSLPVTENDISHHFVSNVRVCSSSDSNKLKLENFAFLPKIIFDKYEEFMYPH
ncbi:putative dihydrofolate reductase, Thymidylate synthase [Helianthus anomalus]